MNQDYNVQIKSKSKRKNIVIIIVMLLAIASIMTGIVLISSESKNSNSDNRFKEELSDVSRAVELIDDSEWNIIYEVTSDSDGYIKSTGENTFILLMVENNEIKDYTHLNQDYKVENDDYEYYKVSLLEYIIKCESSINYKGENYNYEFSVKISVVDPIALFYEIDELNFDTSENMYGGYTTKNLFDNVLKEIFEDNLNSIILEYFETNEKEFESSFELSEYVASEIDQIVGRTTGLRIESNYLNIN